VTASISIGRTSLSLSALSVADDIAGTYVLRKDGLGRPGVTWRLTPMPNSVDVHGAEYIAAVKDETTLVLGVIIQSDSSADLDTAINALLDAVSQFSYTVTVTVDGVGKVWTAAPASWAFDGGYVNDAMVLQHVNMVTLTIPVYPIPGSV
jgi:hypothetical protein